MSDFLIGHIRTAVPLAVGFGITWLARTLDIIIDEETGAQLTMFLTTVVSGAYYFLVRLVAEKVPQVGILLGYNKKPAYNEAV